MGAVLGYEFTQEYAELVRRVFFGDAPGGPVPAGIILANDKPEWAILRDEILFQAQRSHPAVTSRFSFIAIRQPIADRVTVVEQLIIVNGNAAAQNYRFGLTFAAEGASETASGKVGIRDGRRGSTFQPPTTIAEGDDAVGFLTSGQVVQIGAGTFVTITPPRGWVIQPALPRSVGGTSLLVQPDAVNLSVAVIAFGYERRWKDEERSLS